MSVDLAFLLPIALFIIMLGVGFSLQVQDFTRVLKYPKAVVLGVVSQMIILPLIAFLIIKLFALEGAIAVGMMILALCPGGTVSNLFTYMAKGDVALSVTLTSVVSLIAPITVPFFIVLSMELLMDNGEFVTLPIVNTIIQLVLTTILPIGIGMFVRHRKLEWAQLAQKPVEIFSIIFLVALVIVLCLKNIDYLPRYFKEIGIPVILLNISCLSVGYVLARCVKLNRPQSTAISLEVGFQNGALSIFIALTLLNNIEMAIPATCYSLVAFIGGTLFAKYLARRVES